MLSYKVIVLNHDAVENGGHKDDCKNADDAGRNVTRVHSHEITYFATLPRSHIPLSGLPAVARQQSNTLSSLTLPHVFPIFFKPSLIIIASASIMLYLYYILSTCKSSVTMVPYRTLSPHSLLWYEFFVLSVTGLESRDALVLLMFFIRLLYSVLISDTLRYRQRNVGFPDSNLWEIKYMYTN